MIIRSLLEIEIQRTLAERRGQKYEVFSPNG